MTSDAGDLFLSLTPQKVLEAVETAGVQCNPVCYPLNSFENRVYEVELTDKTRIVSKFYRPSRWTQAQILEEHQYLIDLVADEVPVCPTRAFPDGQTLHTIEGIHYCLFDRRGGRAPDELTDDQAERLGMLTARMHNVGAARPAEHRIHLNADTYVRANLAWLKEHKTIPITFEARYHKAANAIADIADTRMNNTDTHRIHGDLHMGNLLMRDGVFNVLDFDDMVVGPAVQDLWLALSGRDEWTSRQRWAYIDGYERFRAFDHGSLRLIEPLRGLRLIHYATWLARRWHDPIFPRTWPHFGTEQYWQEQTSDLEDLLTIIEAEDGPAEKPHTGPELTNKDFFFDWDDK